MLEWKAVSRDMMESNDGGFRIVARMVAPQGMEYKLFRGSEMVGRMECRDTVVDRTETLDELKGYADVLFKVGH